MIPRLNGNSLLSVTAKKTAISYPSELANLLSKIDRKHKIDIKKWEQTMKGNGQKLNRLMKAEGYNPKSLSTATGVAESAIIEMRAGRFKLEPQYPLVVKRRNYANLLAVAKVLDTTPERILNLE